MKMMTPLSSIRKVIWTTTNARTTRTILRGVLILVVFLSVLLQFGGLLSMSTTDITDTADADTADAGMSTGTSTGDNSNNAHTHIHVEQQHQKQQQQQQEQQQQQQNVISDGPVYDVTNDAARTSTASSSSWSYSPATTLLSQPQPPKQQQLQPSTSSSILHSTITTTTSSTTSGNRTTISPSTLQWKNGCLISSVFPTMPTIRTMDGTPALPPVLASSATITNPSTSTSTTSTTGTIVQTSNTFSSRNSNNIDPAAVAAPIDDLVVVPKGIVVTIALAPKNRQHLAQARDQICNNLPNQWEWFLHPQGMDMLLVIQDEDKRWNTKRFARCLNLSNNHSATTSTRTWYNLDGSTLITTQYNYTNTALLGATPSSSTIRIYLATTFVQYPRYVRRNWTRLEDRKDGPPGCSARLRYLQGCRWYTQEMLHLSILQEYDYFLKMDTDIMFRKSPSFYLLQDMQNKGAVFAHAAEYHPKGDGSCAPGILDAVQEFLREVNNHDNNHQQLYSWSNPARVNATQHHDPSHRDDDDDHHHPWRKQVCSSASPEIQRDADQYYGNFLIGKVEYFTSPWLLEFATFLSEYPNGFFKYKWGDQIFWHFAMGLLLDQDYTQYVVDYTDLRCKPDPNCWYSVFDIAQYGPTAAEQCNTAAGGDGDDNLGIFVHSKSLDFVKRVKAENYSFVPALPRTPADAAAGKAPFKNKSKQLFQSTYRHCQPP